MLDICYLHTPWFEWALDLYGSVLFRSRSLLTEIFNALDWHNYKHVWWILASLMSCTLLQKRKWLIHENQGLLWILPLSDYRAHDIVYRLNDWEDFKLVLLKDHNDVWRIHHQYFALPFSLLCVEHTVPSVVLCRPFKQRGLYLISHCLLMHVYLEKRNHLLWPSPGLWFPQEVDSGAIFVAPV